MLIIAQLAKHCKTLLNIVKHNRFGKSTHISMISNSVTYLRSYTNSTIAENSTLISPETPRDRRRRRTERRSLCIERRYRRIEWSLRDRSAKRRCLRIEHRHRRIEWRVFHNVLRVFHDVLLVAHDVLIMVHDVSQCFTCVSWCFTMFNNVLWCLASRTMIGDRQSPQGRFVKSTHISMISNSVTDLRSYINSVITDIAVNSVPISL